MTKFNETAQGLKFIESADSRETSRDVMEAIAFFARNENEAIAIWEGDAIDAACTLRDIWGHATSNGVNDVNLCWGMEGERWADQFKAP